MNPSQGTKTPHRIVVVGGGAAGLELVTRLGHRYARSGAAEVTLVERARTHLWKPLLHAVAAGSLDRDRHELHYLRQAHNHHFTYRFGPMTDIDREAREVLVGATIDDEGRQVTPPSRVPYDTLVICIGSVTNDFGTPGAAEHAVPLENVAQASRFHRRLVNACLRANSQAEPVRPGQLHVAIIGAGATGTELAAELHRTLRAVVAYGLDRIDPARDVRIRLIEAAPRILPALPERISAATMKLLEDLGVEVLAGRRVAEVRADGVVLADGAIIPGELVVWAAGVKGPAVLRNIGGLETTPNDQLVVLPTLQTTRDPDIFALGDCAACPRPDGKGNLPPRAQAAHQQATHLYRQIDRKIRGLEVEPFAYRDFGSLVSLGKYSTVGSLMGFLVGRSMFIEGYFARMMYRSLYKMHQTALHGHAPVLWRTLVGMVADRGQPQVKLH